MALIDNLVSYWKLDVDSSTQDDAHGSHDGTRTSATYTASGKINGGQVFDSSGSTRIAVSDHADFTYTDGFTYHIWFKPGFTIDSGFSESLIWLMSQNAGGNVDGDINVFWHSSPSAGSKGQIQFELSDGSTNYAAVSNSASWTSGTWYHLVATYDDSTLKMYIDGTLQTVTDSLSGQDAGKNAVDLMIGSHSASPWYPFDGTIDEVAVWDRALSQSEVTALYNSGDGFAYPFSTGLNMQVNIGDVWKDVEAIKINIGDIWKDVDAVKLNIGDAWKTV